MANSINNKDFTMWRATLNSAHDNMMDKMHNMQQTLEENQRKIAEGNMLNKGILSLTGAVNFEKAKEEYEQAKKEFEQTNKAILQLAIELQRTRTVANNDGKKIERIMDGRAMMPARVLSLVKRAESSNSEWPDIVYSPGKEEIFNFGGKKKTKKRRTLKKKSKKKSYTKNKKYKYNKRKQTIKKI